MKSTNTEVPLLEFVKEYLTRFLQTPFNRDSGDVLWMKKTPNNSLCLKDWVRVPSEAIDELE